MASEIRVNSITNRSGLSTVTFSDTGVVLSGITTVGILSATGNTVLSGNLNVSGTISGSVSASGVSAFSSGIVVSAGSTSTPSISPNGDSNTGIFFPSADTVCIGEGGTEVIRVDSSSNVGIKTTSTSGFNGACDDIVVSGGADVGMTFYSTSTTGSGNIAFTRGSVSGNTHGAINYNHTSDYMIFQTNLGEKMRIDSVGRVTKPNQPGFLAAKNNSEQTAAGTIVFNTVSTNGGHNIGNHYSTTTGTFTAPIAGRYVFMCSIHATNGNFKVDTRLRINGSDSPGGFALNNVDSYTQATGCVILNLAANDAVTIYHVAGGVWPDANLTYFSGYLLG